MDATALIIPSSEFNSYIYVILDAISHYVVLHSWQRKNAVHAIDILLYHWFANFTIPDVLATDIWNKITNRKFTYQCRPWTMVRRPGWK